MLQRWEFQLQLSTFLRCDNAAARSDGNSLDALPIGVHP
jgi:hypothetical protein